MGNSCGIDPTELITSVWPVLTSNENSPLASVLVPVDVPFINTEAFGMGTFKLSETVPVMRFCARVRENQEMKV